ncbi:MAG TPA: antibiotic biosynthesis monooxygenase [Jatrophihabitans sp.]|uniref:antibiotic biosynthesis monooxygenase family protein n=1 Tax=Jatrophihabitans sp. TaxID=1932789 RepID=UPI002F11921B
MSIIKINAITVAADSGDELAKRFAARAGAVDNQDGFEGFELLQPTDGRTTWLVLTRWRDEDAFNAWASSPAFGQGHRSEGPHAQGGEGGGSPHAHGAEGGEQPKKPVGVSSELWSYVVAGGSAGGSGS